MPPRNKFNKKEILQACLAIVREQGIAGITARSVAAKLDSSSKVIFGLFENMEALTHAIVIAAEEMFVERVQTALQEEKAFRAVGLAYIQFAAEEPKLFQLIFMNEPERPIRAFSEFLPVKDYSYDKMIASLQEEYGLSKELSERLYQHLFIYSHGIASMTAAGIYRFSAEEITGLLTEVFTAFLKEITGE
ncbi:TetR/AcrR family transcriptional regulator [Streptococcus panodentis]|uniref:TetR family transcriptional regulator n=1 Tax=Streptococcus panodentis TaxID=1581472 RepID=A0ABS5AT76_9STRE|nr:TetR/AcrR family transcriptional regulator [Streptococcus panodentis]MBP2619777.1 TetR family transcriptional regulator [Streptococcus panodentis]